MSRPLLSIIVVFYNMAREAPRTLYTLSPVYQRGVDASDYEVLAIDHGSNEPLDPELVHAFGDTFRLFRYQGAHSPARAINEVARHAHGEFVMVCIDGARMLSPGLVRWALAGMRGFHNPVVATLAWHLGAKVQNLSVSEGYNQRVEDALLASVDWKGDGYELFRISCLANSSRGGWFRPLWESNAVCVRREAFESLGGFDERFTTPGGGFVNLDFFKRACEQLGQLVLLTGEGTFHQFHGGVATNTPMEHHPLRSFEVEYMALNGRSFTPPTVEPCLLGSVPVQCAPFWREAVALHPGLESKQSSGKEVASTSRRRFVSALASRLRRALSM
jgi:hypothetical protein